MVCARSSSDLVLEVVVERKDGEEGRMADFLSSDIGLGGGAVTMACLSGLAHDRPGDKYGSADISFFCDKKRRLRKGCSICDR